MGATWLLLLRRQHALSLLAEVSLVLGLDILVDYILEYLDYIVYIMVHSLHFFAVLIVRFTVGAEHQKALDYLRVHDPRHFVQFSVFPDAFRYQFHEAQMPLVPVETTLRISFVGVFRKHFNCSFVVLNQKTQEIVDPLKLESVSCQVFGGVIVERGVLGQDGLNF